MKAKKAKFKVDFMDGEYEGYYIDAPGNTWNGHACPFLTYQAKTKFLSDLGAYAPMEIETEEGTLLLFPLGSQQLKWEVVDDDESE